MLAYAPRRHAQPGRPGLFALLLLGHVAIIATAMATKFVIDRDAGDATKVILIPEDKPPEPPPPVVEDPAVEPPISTLTTTPRIVETPVLDGPIFTEVPGPVIQPGPIAGTAVIQDPPLPPIHQVVRKGPRFATAADRVRPPYPESMRASEKEAVLRLRLSIDERGRVVVVEPVGRIEPAFLEAARRHILKSWRYQPATEDGRAVPSSTTVTLKFEIGDA